MSMTSADQNPTTRLLASIPRQIVEMFNVYFTSAFSLHSLDHAFDSAPLEPGAVLTYLHVPQEQILAFLRQLNVNKACGTDSVPARFLKPEQISPSLSLLFNKSLRLGLLPEDWKLANIVPILKKGKNLCGKL